MGIWLAVWLGTMVAPLGVGALVLHRVGRRLGTVGFGTGAGSSR